jgi:Asp-tRNA(Asn)/Glu-tRNA(Gln) amidotransferase A subunit family amidase
MDMDITLISATEASEAIRAGRMTSEGLVSACLERIAAIEDGIGAWAYLDADHALKQACEADRIQQDGQTLGLLHGIPVGVKDIFDTGDMPTEDGTVLHAGRQPQEDATAVALLREAGAVILGKTVTTELAVYAPGKTRNPHDLKRTPGGSSSGSAAAVALRGLRVQAELRTYIPSPCAPTVATSGSGGCVRAHHRGCGADRGADHGLR